MEQLFRGKAFRIERDGTLGILTFDLDGERINKFSTPAALELGQVLDRLEKNSDGLKALLFRSAKKDSYIVGADINEIKGLKNRDDAEKASAQGQALFNRLEDLKIPSIAAIHGPCMGGGTEWSLAATYRVASDSPRTAIAVPEVKLGFLPGWGGTFRLPRLIGLSNSLDMILTGKNIRGDKAEKLGLVDFCFPATGFEERCLALGHELARHGKLKKYPRKVPLLQKVLDDNPLGRAVVFRKAREGVMKQTRGLYPAPLRILKVLESYWGADRKKFLIKEAEAFADLWATPESKSLVGLFFMMEAAKKTTGASSLSETELKALAPIEQMAILGAGVMGGGIASQSAQSNIRVVMKDIQMDAVAKGLLHVEQVFKKQVDRKRLNRFEKDRRMGLVGGQIDYQGFHGMDLVVEAVVENLEVKRKVFAELEGVVREDCIIASNTSSLRLQDMVSAFRRPERFVGLHYFNPVEKMPLVEVITLPSTDPKVVARAVNYVKAIGKTPVVCQDGPGFVVNRLLLPWLNEAAYLLEEGHDMVIMDRVMKDFGMPMGPFELMDEVGIDVGAKVAHILHQAFGERAKPSQVLDKMVDYNKKQPFEKQRLGKKNGLGFYQWTGPMGKRKEADVGGIRDILAQSQRSASLKPQDYQWRMMFPMINEAAILLDEKLVASPADVDLAMIFGTGFAPFRGGLLRFADGVGLAKVVSYLDGLAKTCGPRIAASESLKRYAKQGSFYGS